MSFFQKDRLVLVSNANLWQKSLPYLQGNQCQKKTLKLSMFSKMYTIILSGCKIQIFVQKKRCGTTFWVEPGVLLKLRYIGTAQKLPFLYYTKVPIIYFYRSTHLWYLLLKIILTNILKLYLVEELFLKSNIFGWESNVINWNFNDEMEID